MAVQRMWKGMGNTRNQGEVRHPWSSCLTRENRPNVPELEFAYGTAPESSTCRRLPTAST